MTARFGRIASVTTRGGPPRVRRPGLKCPPESRRGVPWPSSVVNASSSPPVVARARNVPFTPCGHEAVCASRTPLQIAFRTVEMPEGFLPQVSIHEG